jgi:hypothetical protein
MLILVGKDLKEQILKTVIPPLMEQHGLTTQVLLPSSTSIHLPKDHMSISANAVIGVFVITPLGFAIVSMDILE